MECKFKSRQKSRSMQILCRYSDLLRELGVVVYHRPKSSYFHKTVECTYIDRLQMGVVIYHRPIEFFH